MIAVQRARGRLRRRAGSRGRGSRPGPAGWLWRPLVAVSRPFALALWQGDSDPPPAVQRLRLRVPRRLLPLLPFRTVTLVQAADLVLALILFAMAMSTFATWNFQAARVHAVDPSLPGPLPEWLAYLTAFGSSLPVALRDSRPLAAWRMAAALLPVSIWVDCTIGHNDPPFSNTIVPAYLLVLYSVGVRSDRQISLGVWLISVLAAWIVHPNSMPLVTVVVTVALAFGYNVRARRRATAKLIVEEYRSHAAESAQAVLAERARIARELHDVVAHHMSVIAIQAEAVPLKAQGDPARLESGLSEIRQLSLEAITELRQVLGVLRDQDGRTDTAPQPGLDRIGELVANARAAGLAVLVKRPQAPGGLPPAVELSAYRIVQESLSNVMRHAPGAPVAVDIALDGGELLLHVVNGPSAEPAGAPGAGQGLLGMRERATLLGGTLAAGPAAGGGFEVRARLPIADRESV